ncbi:MAG: P-loop NTPase [Halobacteriaceae archaeon]
MILAVAGGKGGVGKSTVALNLAVELDAVLVDADLTMADLPTGPGPDLHDVLAGQAPAHAAVRAGGLVDVLPCGRTLTGARLADPTRLPTVLESVAARYGDVVVDTPAGMEADAGLPLAAAEACVLVTTADRAAIADAVRTRELARELDAGLVRVVLNAAGTRPPTEEVRAALGAPVVSIDRSQSVATAQAQGLPVRSVAPQSTPVDQFESLAVAVESCKS